MSTLMAWSVAAEVVAGAVMIALLVAPWPREPRRFRKWMRAAHAAIWAFGATGLFAVAAMALEAVA